MVFGMSLFLGWCEIALKGILRWSAPGCLFFGFVCSVLWSPVLTCLVSGCFGAYTETFAQKGMADHFLMCTVKSSGRANSFCLDPKRQNSRRSKATKQTKAKPRNGQTQAFFVPVSGCWRFNYLELVQESMFRKGSTTMRNKNALKSCLEKASDIQSPPEVTEQEWQD